MKNPKILSLFLVPVLILLLFLLQPLLAKALGEEIDLYVEVSHYESHRIGNQYHIHYPFQEIPGDRIPVSFRDDERQLYAVFDRANADGLPRITDERPKEGVYLLCRYDYESPIKIGEEKPEATAMVRLNFDLDDTLPLYQETRVDHGSGIITLKVFRGYGLITNFQWITQE